MNDQEVAGADNEIPRKTARRACTLLLAGLVSMTVVAVGERTGDLDEFRAWVAGNDSLVLPGQARE